MLCLYVALGVMCLYPPGLQARGAGRAFPIHAEEYAINRFTSINPNIEWDPTNHLVDRSGQFATCDNVRRGYQATDVMTPDGETIGVVHDYFRGEGVDAGAANVYVASIIDSWMTSHKYDATIRGALRFGCSVRPGCAGVVTVVACLFSPGKKGVKFPNDPPTPDIMIKAQAFTPEQYALAERITGTAWDRSHFIENLSGTETSCSMLLEDNWLFKKAKEVAAVRGIELEGLEGRAPNRGDTEVAMVEILKGFKSIQSAFKVGCSLIPDCRDGRSDVGGMMWVVVSCLYEVR